MKASTLIIAICLAALCACDKNSNEHRLPSSESELKEFLIRIQAESQPQILNQQQQGISLNEKMVIIPVKLSLMEDGLGLMWERTILGIYTDEQTEALKIVSEVPYEYMGDYCQSPSIDWMRDYDYRIYEKLFTESGVLIRDFEVNLHACEKYLESTRNQ